MKPRLLLAVLATSAVAAIAQEAPDLTGTWSFTVDGLEPHPRCGESIQEGVLRIERRVTAMAFRGRVRAEDSYEKCDGTQVSESMVTIRVKDDGRVTIEYDEDGWELERLRFADGVLTGSRGKGVSTRWERAAADQADAPSAEQLAALEEFLGAVEPDLATTLSREYQAVLNENLQRSGLNEDEAAQVTSQTLARMTSCMLEELRKAVMAQQIPVQQILDRQDVSVIFNPQSMDMRANGCVQDAAWNAGVPIR